MSDTNKSSTEDAFEETLAVDLDEIEALGEEYQATQAMDAVSAQALYSPADTFDELSTFEDDGMATLPVSSAQAEAMLAQIEAAQKAAQDLEDPAMASTVMMDHSSIEAIEKKAAAQRSTQIEPPEKVAELLSEAQKLAKRPVPATVAERAIPKTQHVQMQGMPNYGPPPTKRTPTALYLAIGFVALLIIAGIAFVVIVALG